MKEHQMQPFFYFFFLRIRVYLLLYTLSSQKFGSLLPTSYDSVDFLGGSFVDLVLKIIYPPNPRQVCQDKELINIQKLTKNGEEDILVSYS